MWLSFASGGRSIHSVWFSSGGVVWFSYELLFYHMWCVCVDHIIVVSFYCVIWFRYVLVGLHL